MQQSAPVLMASVTWLELFNPQQKNIETKNQLYNVRLLVKFHGERFPINLGFCLFATAIYVKVTAGKIVVIYCTLYSVADSLHFSKEKCSLG